MTDETQTELAETNADASRKLSTVTAILTEMEAQGVHNVKTELVKALLKPAEEALKRKDMSDI